MSDDVTVARIEAATDILVRGEMVPEEVCRAAVEYLVEQFRTGGLPRLGNPCPVSGEQLESLVTGLVADAGASARMLQEAKEAAELKPIRFSFGPLRRIVPGSETVEQVTLGVPTDITYTDDAGQPVSSPEPKAESWRDREPLF